MRYEYTGPGPAEDPGGGLVRPGDIREFDAEPAWGPWRLLDEPPQPAQKPAPPAAAQPSVPPPASSLPGASTAPPATDTKGM